MQKSKCSPRFIFFILLNFLVFGSTVAGAQAKLVQAAGQNWIIEEVTGKVTLATPSQPMQNAKPGDLLPPGGRVTTEAGARAVLSQGGDRMTVSANSVVEIAADSKKSIMTRVMQTLGTVLFAVEKGSSDRFEVETPYLAATVKGTVFTVSIRNEGAAVHVTEGAVQVATVDRQRSVVVRPGQTGAVSSKPGAGVEIRNREGRGERETIGGDQAVESAATGDNNTGVRGETSGPDKGVGQGGLNRKVGEAPADFAKLTNGFASNASGANRSGPKGQSVDEGPAGSGKASGLGKNTGLGGGVGGNGPATVTSRSSSRGNALSGRLNVTAPVAVSDGQPGQRNNSGSASSTGSGSVSNGTARFVSRSGGATVTNGGVSASNGVVPSNSNVASKSDAPGNAKANSNGAVAENNGNGNAGANGKGNGGGKK